MPSHLYLYEIRYIWLVFALLLKGSSAIGRDIPSLPTDKAAHFGLSSIAVEASLKTCQVMEGTPKVSAACRGWSSGLVLTAGLLKEFSDQQHGRRFDQQDLVANILGVVTGNLLQWDF